MHAADAKTNNMEKQLQTKALCSTLKEISMTSSVLPVSAVIKCILQLMEDMDTIYRNKANNLERIQTTLK